MRRSVQQIGNRMGDGKNRSLSLSFPKPVVLMIGAALILASCGDSTKRALGLARTSPDEFAVVKRAPLSQPPDFKLRPPRPGADRPGVASTREQARQAIFRGEEPTATRTAQRNEGPRTTASPQGAVSRFTPGETAFLARAGADDVEPDIRTKVDRESALLAEADLNFVQRLLNFEPDVDELVDAPAEARRLRQNQALGRDATEGDTPLIDRKTNQLFKIF